MSDVRGPGGTAVIAIGNEYRRDDGAAQAALRLLLRDGAPADRCDLTDGESTRLLALWRDRDLAVVIDAVHAHPGEPGRIHRLDLAQAALASGGATTHGLGLGEAVELGRVLGLLPSRLVVVGIEGERFDWGEQLTPAVAAAVPRAAALVRELLEDERRTTERTSGPR
ncbi:hydrogenase maturation protease [Streptacidiphilus sp. EB129]|uniref:hydrogenase maturation protease n=1 Tax=Streptacidiphilus sp. EB129 TaxID=3156262 RepID=UPI00351523A1